MARPQKYSSQYDQDVATRICDELSAGRSLRTICGVDGLPDRTTVWRWMAKFPEFRAMVELAQEMQAHAIAEECFDIADNPAMAASKEMVALARLQVDTRKWYLSKISKRFADKVQQQHTGPDGGVPTLNVVIRSVLDAPSS